MTVRELVTVLGFKLDDAPVKKYDKQIDTTKGKTDKLAAATKGIGMAWKIAAAAAAVGMAWISKNILEATGEMEQYRNQLQKFTGDADKAAAVLAELRDTTADPLFGTGNVVNAYKQLRNLGMEADSASHYINVLGDIADGSTENFNALSNILTRVSVSGKVNEGTMRQLTNAGFSMQDMAEALGKSTAQLEADIRAGRIGFQELTLAMNKATQEGGRFYQNMERQARTFSGSVKILKDTISSIGDAVGTKVLPKIVDTIRYITDLIKLGRDGFVNFGAKAFDALITSIQYVIVFFEILQMRIKRFGGGFSPLKAIFEDVFGFLKSVIKSAVPFLLNLAMLFVAVFRPIQAFIKPVLESLKPIIEKVFGFFADVLGEIISIVDGMTPYFEKLGGIISRVFEKLAPVLDNVKNALLAAFKPIKAFVKPVVESLLPLFEKVFGAIGKLFGKAGEDTKGLAYIIEGLTPLFSTLGEIVGYLVDILGSGLVAAIQIVSGAFQVLWNAVKLIFWPLETIIKVIIGLFTGGFRGALDVLKGQFGKLGEIFSGIFNGIKTILGGVFGFIKNIFSSFGTFVSKIFGGIWDVIKNIFGKVGEFFAGVWNGIKDFFVNLWKNIKQIFSKAWEGIKNIFTGVVDSIKNIWNSIIGFFSGIWDGIKNIFSGIGNWFGEKFTAARDAITGAFNNVKDMAGNVWGGIKNVASRAADSIKQNWSQFTDWYKNKTGQQREAAAAVWGNIKNIAGRVTDNIKQGWGKFTDWYKERAAQQREAMSTAWQGIKNVTGKIGDGIKNIAGKVWDLMPEGLQNVLLKVKDLFMGAVEKIQNIWNGIKNFFAGLWESIKQGPVEALEFIKNAFFGLFDGIKDKFFGFINVIKEGWEKAKGFFGGVAEGAKNIAGRVGEFFTGGGKNEAQPVNDLIVTPEGKYSTHPEDFVMAMKNPGDLIDALMKFLGGRQPQPAYAGAGRLAGNTLTRAISQNSYNSSNTSNVSNITAPINVHVNASGMTPEAASAAVKRGVQDALHDAIHSSRGAVMSPEARRH